MRLSKNSWHVHLNDFVYGYGYSEDTNNLCPYFWGTILAIIGAIPVLVIRGLSNTLSNGVKVCLLRYGLASFWITVGALTGMTWFIVLGVILIFFNLILYNTAIFDNIAKRLFGWGKPKKSKPHKERKPHMTIEMFKGWKNKHCPMVEWE